MADRIRVYALVAPANRPAATPALDRLAAAGYEVIEGHPPAGEYAVFFASAAAVEPGPLTPAAATARRGGKLVCVALDDIGLEVVRPWQGVKVLEAHRTTANGLADELLRLLPPVPPREPKVPPPVVTPKAFVSYAGRDQNFVDWLKPRMERDGWEVWAYRESERNTQTSLQAELVDRIREAEAVVLVLTPEWTASEYTGLELNAAIEFERFIVPLSVLGDERKVLNRFISTVGRVPIDFRTEKEYGYGKLKAALVKCLQKSAAPPAGG